jgi:hypothetical protein
LIKSTLTVQLDKKLHYALKIKAVETDKSITAIISDLLLGDRDIKKTMENSKRNAGNP